MQDTCQPPELATRETFQGDMHRFCAFYPRTGDYLHHIRDISILTRRWCSSAQEGKIAGDPIEMDLPDEPQ